MESPKRWAAGPSVRLRAGVAAVQIGKVALPLPGGDWVSGGTADIVDHGFLVERPQHRGSVGRAADEQVPRKRVVDGENVFRGSDQAGHDFRFGCRDVPDRRGAVLVTDRDPIVADESHAERSAGTA